MAFIGSGAESDPFLVTNAEEFKEAWEGGLRGGNNWFRLTNDIDLTSVGAIGTMIQYRRFDGAGHRITGARFVASPFLSYNTVQFINLDLIIESGFTNNSGQNGLVWDFENTRIEWRHAGTLSLSLRDRFSKLVNTIFTGLATVSAINGARFTDLYLACDASDSFKAKTGVVAINPVDRLLAASYPALDTNIWLVEDGRIPELLVSAYDYSDLTHVKGITTIDGIPESRLVRIFDARTMTFISGMTSDDQGVFDISVRPYTDPVLVLANDDLGTKIKAETSYALDDIVVPPDGNGYRYICIQAGTTADPLPDFPWPTDQLTSGDAIFEARKIRQPIVEGPLTPAPVIPPSEQEQ